VQRLPLMGYLDLDRRPRLQEFLKEMYDVVISSACDVPDLSISAN
jgi:hypothetical protein